MQYSLFQDWFHYLWPFGLGGAVKAAEEEDDLIRECLNTLMTKLFIDQPLAWPRSTK